MFIMNLGSPHTGEVYLKPDGDDTYWMIAKPYGGEEQKLMKLIKAPDEVPDNTLAKQIEDLVKWKDNFSRYFEDYRKDTGDDFKSFEQWLNEQPKEESDDTVYTYDTDFLLENWAFNTGQKDGE